MFWPIARSKSIRRVPLRRPHRVTPLRGESLEQRLTLDGTVAVVLAGTTLTLTGDIDANDVLISKGENPNDIVIEGKDRDGNVTTFINGPSLIQDPVSQIEVYLQGGSDDFRIEGNSAQDRLVLGGPLIIENHDGDNVNRLEYVVVASTLDIVKVSGNSESSLEIVGTDIVGQSNIDNNNGGQGPTKMLVMSGSTFQDHVSIFNGDGKDILVVDTSNFDGDLDVDNGNGDTRTIFGMAEDPIVFGDLTVTNGDGNDTFVLNDTTVWGTVDIDNGDGHSDTTVSQARVGMGEAAAAGNTVFELDSGEGRDTFLMNDVEVNDGVELDYAANNSDGQGSSTTIMDTTIRGYLEIESDDGRDLLAISDTTSIGQEFNLDLNHGSSDVTLADLTVGLSMELFADAGRDVFVIERTTVNSNVSIEVGDGIDRLEILDGTTFVGQTALSSGAGVDTLVRQVGPAEHAIDLVFLLLEDFELNEFITSSG